jgi:hypothetical protein
MDTYARPAEGAKNQKPKQIKRSQPSAAPTGAYVERLVGCQPAFASEQKAQPITHVGAAEGCDLLILLLKDKVKGSRPSAAPTGDRIGKYVVIASKLCSYKKQQLNAHRFCLSPLNRMSVSSAAAFDL